MLRALWLSCFVTVLFIGCRAHVELPPPPPDGEALSVYRSQMRPVGRGTERITRTVVDEAGNPLRTSSSSREGLVLERGDVIYFPEDLAIVVGQLSECATIARDAGAARTTTELWGGGGGALIGASLVVLIANPEVRLGLDPPIPVSPSAVVVGVAGAFSLVMMAVTNGETAKRREDAFSCYEEHFGSTRK